MLQTRLFSNLDQNFMTMFLGKVKVKHDYSRARSLCKDALAGEVEYGILPIAQSKHVHICVFFPESIAQQVGRGIAIFNVQHDGFRIVVSALSHKSPPFRLSAERGACPTVEKENAVSLV